VPDVLRVQSVRIELALLLPLFRDAKVHLVQCLKHRIYVLTVCVDVQICINLFTNHTFDGLKVFQMRHRHFRRPAHGCGDH